MNADDIDRLQQELDRIPAPFEPLDVVALDGFLVAVQLQPKPAARERWLPLVTDADGRALPAAFDVRPLQALVLRRHAELADAIARRQWFDPWILALDGDAADDPSGAVLPWVAGFATAMEAFPQLVDRDDPAFTEALALVYRHLDTDDLEDAEALIEEIESLEPPEDLAESVEGLVRATLLIADLTHPVVQRPQPVRRPRR